MSNFNNISALSILLYSVIFSFAVGLMNGEKNEFSVRNIIGQLYTFKHINFSLNNILSFSQALNNIGYIFLMRS